MSSGKDDERRLLSAGSRKKPKSKSTFAYDAGREEGGSYGSIRSSRSSSSKVKPRSDNLSAGRGSESDVSERSSHCHESLVRRPDSNSNARKTLIIASVLCLFFMIVEIVGGYIAGSLAIMTDAAHLLSDFASFMISLVSLFLASRPATRRMSFGWHRAEVIGAVVSVLMIWVLTGILVYVAIERIIAGIYEIQGVIMLVTAGIGVAVNLIMGVVLHRGGHAHSHGGAPVSNNHNHNHSHNGKSNHGHSHNSNSKQQKTPNPIQAQDGGIWLETGLSRPHLNNQHSVTPSSSSELLEHDEERERSWFKLPWKRGQKKKADDSNINIRAALIHVIGDFVQSVGIFIAALIIYFRPDLAIMDPICTFIFSVVVLVTTITVMRDALNVLMEGLPRGMSFTEVAVALQSLRGVIKVHDLRIWSLTMDKVALSVHLAVDQRRDTQDILKQATQLVRERFGVYECTVQIEHYSNAMDECKSCETPEK